jgi:hypothetical protein
MQAYKCFRWRGIAFDRRRLRPAALVLIALGEKIAQRTGLQVVWQRDKNVGVLAKWPPTLMPVIQGRSQRDTIIDRGHKNPDFSGCLMLPYFKDWTHFCLVLREIAFGVDGFPLSGNEAQQRAQEALTGAGYGWSGYKPEAPKAIEPSLQGKEATGRIKRPGA